MTKYIDADALIKHLSDYALAESPNDTDSMKDRLIHETAYSAINECINAVEEMPTTDVEPVRHGKWVHVGNAMCACSVCGDIHLGRDDNNGWSDSLYCGHCGAKMDGGSV